MDMNSLSHSRWECKCHIVFAPNRAIATIMGLDRASAVATM